VLESDSFLDLYNSVCNIESAKRGWVDQRNKRATLHPIYKLQIALKLSEGADRVYKYRPHHIIYDELCMVLEDRTFRLTTDMKAVEIPVEQYNPYGQDNVRVRAIAFGPDSDTSVRGVSLWFNIDETQLSMCTPQQAKRFRFKRANKNDEKDKILSSAFETLDCFELTRPHDLDAYQLVKEIMLHRLAVLKADQISNMRTRFEQRSMLDDKRKAIHDRFEAVKASWMLWAWPVNDGREKVDKRTPVPPVESEYNFKTVDKENSIRLASATKNIWSSFVEQSLGEYYQDVHTSSESSINRTNIRLSVLYHLGLGFPVSSDRTLPAARLSIPICDMRSDDARSWATVRDHFDKSRSKKVLTVVQTRASPSPITA
jgi:hypothetical protein